VYLENQTLKQPVFCDRIGTRTKCLCEHQELA